MIYATTAAGPNRLANGFRAGRGALAHQATLGRLADTILAEHENTCSGCHFQSRRDLELELIDPAGAPVGDNLAPVCFICAAILRLSETAEHKHGVLIWMPEITQPVLNHIIRAAYAGKMAQATRDAALTVLATLRDQQQPCIDAIGFADPASLDQALQELPPPAVPDFLCRIAGVRYLPLDNLVRDGKNVFMTHVADWRSPAGPFAHALPATWPDLVARLNPAS